MWWMSNSCVEQKKTSYRAVYVFLTRMALRAKYHKGHKKKKTKVTHEAYMIRRRHSPEHELWNHTALLRIPAKPLPSVHPEEQSKV